MAKDFVLGGAAGLPRADLGIAISMALDDPGKGCVGTYMAPIWDTGSITGARFTPIDWSAYERKNVQDLRPIGGTPNEVVFHGDDKEFTCEFRGLTGWKDPKILEGYGAGRARTVEEAEVQLVMRQMLLDHEQRVLSAYDASGMSSSTPAVKWSATSSTTVRANLHTAIESTITGTNGVAQANACAASYKVWHALARNSELAGLIAPRDLPESITVSQVQAWVQQYLGLEYALEGRGDNWDSNTTFYLFYTPGTTISDPESEMATAITAMPSGEMEVIQHDPSPFRREYHVVAAMDELVVHTECAYRLTAVIT